MQNNYLLEGDNYLAVQKKIEQIIKKQNFLEATTSNYTLSEVDLEVCLEDLDTYSFLSNKKVIIITDLEVINQDENKKSLDHLYKYLDNPNPDNLLFLCSNKLNNTLKITKELKKRTNYIEVSLNPISFIKESLKDYKIEANLIEYLSNKCLGDITKLESECNKLKNYKITEKEILKQDIDDIVVEKLGDSQELTFAFSKALAMKDTKDALMKYQQLLSYNIEPLNIIGLLASQIRIIYQVKVLEGNGLSDNDITQTLKEKNSYRIKKTRELTKYYTEKELLSLMRQLHEVDLKIKSSDSDPKTLLELFILNSGQ